MSGVWVNSAGTQRAATTVIARMRPSIAPVPKRRASACAAACVTLSSREASRASISLRSGVPWQ